MRLGELLAAVPGAEASGDPDREVNEVRDDSRLVGPGDLFVALAGNATDGRSFVAEAAARGAGTLVLEDERAPRSELPGDAAAAPVRSLFVPTDFAGTVVTVPNARHALAVIAANRFGAARALTLSAVTGTNGKTTTTYLMEAILTAAGFRAGVVGTIGYRLPPAAAGASTSSLSRPAPLTTPGALALQGLFADMLAAGATDVVLEASSHALDQSRLDGCSFAVAALTNLTRDHLDYHRTMERYMDAKAILFERLLNTAHGTAVLPIDRPEGRAMRARVRGRATLTVSAEARGTVGSGAAAADVAVEKVRMSATGLWARLSTPGGRLDLKSRMVGDFNLANMVLAVGMAFARGVPLSAIAAGIDRLNGVPGRLERVDNERDILCLVDYAHTPDALERALAAVRPLVATGGRLLTVFGCGGDRDRTKRPLMGQAAARGSDIAIVTSDNPRGESPEAIIAMIVEGVRETGLGEIGGEAWDASLAAETSDMGSLPARGYLVTADRRLAIRRAIAAARPGDVVLVAGKGHEDYQIVGATRFHFDDREEVRAALALAEQRRAPSSAPSSTTDSSGSAAAIRPPRTPRT